jgi:DNA polymerase-3 subunit delta
MKLTAYQLDAHLQKTLAPLYLISGDEILLVQEAIDQIRAAGRKAGYSERISLSVESGTDWAKTLYAEAHSFSLFATKRIVELQLAGTKPNAEISKILLDLVTNPPPDTLLLISSQKLDSKIEKSNWYKALDKNGIVMPLWPITLDQLPTWITQRAKKIGLQFTPDAAKRLAEHVEGNLLAAAQEIEKLSLLQTAKAIDAQTIENTVTDNARFDIFHLVDCALSGNSKRCLRMLDALKAEDAEPILILWALTRELRTLAELAKQTRKGSSLATLFSQFRIWEKRQPAVRRFLQHHTQQHCWTLLSQSARIDKLLKGALPGNVWNELQQLTLNIAR